MERSSGSAGSTAPSSPSAMRLSEKRRNARPFLVSSRTNSRPQLPRYAASSTLPLEEHQSETVVEEEVGFSSSGILLSGFAERRASLLEEIHSLPAGSVQSDKAVAEEALVLSRSASEPAVIPMSTSGGCYTAYSNFPMMDNAPSSLPSSQSQAVELSEFSRLDLFHQYLAELEQNDDMSTQARLQKYEQLISVVENFLHEAECYGKVILQEIAKPISEKTIKPLRNNGVLGGEKFLHAGIYFKLAIDKSGLLGGFDGARKVARHEIKSLAALMNARVRELRFPLICLVSYCGLTIVAMTQLLIDGSSLVYGSSDAGKTLHFSDEETLSVCKSLGEKLNLRAHRPSNCSENVQVYTPVDMEVHRAKDGFLYALDFSRLFPPTSVRKDVQGGQFQQLFRPEFIAKGKSLCSDAFTQFLHSSQRSVVESEIFEAMDRLHHLVAQFASELSVRPVPSRIGNDREYAMQVVVIIMHSRGINCRYLGDIRNLCLSEYWKAQILISMVMRRLKRRLMSQMRCLHLGNCGLSAILEGLIDFFNLIFCSSKESSEFWQNYLLSDVQDYFGAQSDLANVKDFKLYFMSLPIEESSSVRLLAELTKKCSLKWGSLLDYYKAQPHLLLVSQMPFGYGDCEEVPVEVTHLPVLLFAKAKVKQILAARCSGSRSFFLNWSSVSYFVRALDVLTTKEILRNIASTLGLIGAQAAAREYFEMALSMDANDGRTLFKLANFYDASFNLDDAEENYLSSLESDRMPSVHRLCTYADFLLSGRHDVESAVSCYEACLHLCSNHGEASHNLAMVLAKKNSQRAEELLEIAILNQSDSSSYGRAVRNAAHFFEMIGKRDRAEQLSQIALSFEYLTNSGVLVYHCTKNEAEFAEIVSILGVSRKFKIGHLRLDSLLVDVTNLSIEEAAKKKAMLLFNRVSFPVCTEVVYIEVVGRSFTGKQFDEIGAEEFVNRFGEGTEARAGVVVSYTNNGRDVFTYESSIAGTLVRSTRKGYGWDSIFKLTEFGLTLTQISDVNLKDFISFRRFSYLKMWLAQFPGE